jgi:hypothetical protein
MKRIFISTLVGAIIFFAYQSLSWTVLPFHDNSLYTANNQYELLNSLSEHLPEDGYYFIPNFEENNQEKESYEDFNENMNGKAYAMISYRKARTSNMGLSMIKGFSFNFMGLLFASFILFKLGKSVNSFGKYYLMAMLFPIIIFFMQLMTTWNWWDTHWHFLKTEILDLFFGWALSSIWLAWYVNKHKKV